MSYRVDCALAIGVAWFHAPSRQARMLPLIRVAGQSSAPKKLRFRSVSGTTTPITTVQRGKPLDSPNPDIGAFQSQKLTITSIAAVSPNPRNSAVSTIDVMLSAPINTSDLITGALVLSDDGSGNLINSGVTISLAWGDTYAIGGLSILTAAEGEYTLTVNAADIQDQYGFAGTGTASVSWLMDTTPPTSTVNPLPARGTSLSFPVSVTGSDGGNPPSGLASYAIYVSVNGGSWSLWKTIPASNPTAAYTGQSDTTYAFYSIATDNAGNVEIRQPVIEASTYLPDLTPPVTSVDGTAGPNPSTINTSTGTFTLNVTGSDPGGGILTYFEVFASVDGSAYTMINAAAIPAGPPSSQGITCATIPYQGLTDGNSHTYGFYSIGFDSAGHVQPPPSAPSLTLSEIFATGPSSPRMARKESRFATSCRTPRASRAGNSQSPSTACTT